MAIKILLITCYVILGILALFLLYTCYVFFSVWLFEKKYGKEASEIILALDVNEGREIQGNQEVIDRLIADGYIYKEEK